MKINLSNIEEKIFQNSELRKSFPEFAPYFSEWDLGNKISHLKSKKYVINLLNNLNSRHLKILEYYFKEPITVNKVEINFMKNLSSTKEKIETELNNLKKEFYDFCVCREGEKVDVSLWK